MLEGEAQCSIITHDNFLQPFGRYKFLIISLFQDETEDIFWRKIYQRYESFRYVVEIADNVQVFGYDKT